MHLNSSFCLNFKIDVQISSLNPPKGRQTLFLQLSLSCARDCAGGQIPKPHGTPAVWHRGLHSQEPPCPHCLCTPRSYPVSISSRSWTCLPFEKGGHDWCLRLFERPRAAESSALLCVHAADRARIWRGQGSHPSVRTRAQWDGLPAETVCAHPGKYSCKSYKNICQGCHN